MFVWIENSGVNCVNLVTFVVCEIWTLLIRISVFKMAVSWLGQLVGNLSPWRPGFNPRLVLARSLVDKVALGQIFFRVICFPSLYHSSNALYWSSSCRFCYQEDKRAKRGSLQIKHWSFGNMSTVNKSTFFSLPILTGFCIGALGCSAIQVDWRNSTAVDQSLWTFQNNVVSSFRFNILWLPGEASRQPFVYKYCGCKFRLLITTLSDVETCYQLYQLNARD